MSSQAGWTQRTVADCLVPISFRSKRQIQTRDYQAQGRFPIIDQGQQAIAGWTDDESAVINAPLPVVVFGDHSRTLKYVDFPFVRGADGTQVLVAADGLDPRFLYYACKLIDVPARGYNRHFGQLKESSFAQPVSLDTQRAISSALRLIEEAVSLESTRIATTSNIKRLVMAEVFSSGLRGEELKQTPIGPMPESWSVAPFDAAIDVKQGLVDPKVEPYSSMLHVGPENVEADTGYLLPCRTARELGLISGKFHFSAGDIVYSKIRPYLNKVVMPDFDGICSADMYPLQPRTGFDARFLFQYLLSTSFLRQAVPHQLRTGIPKVNREQLSDTSIPRPSEAEQQEIARVLDAIDRTIDLHRRKRTVLEKLLKTLLHKLMTGEIDVNDLDLSALDREAEVAA